MGVCMSPGGACWSYGGFMRFRRRVAFVEGIDLFRCEYYVEAITNQPGYYRSPDYSTIIPEEHIVRWRDVSSKVKRLLTHSDCEGFLTPKECARMVDRLDEIVELFPDGDYDKQEGRKLVAGMKACVETKKWMKFR